MDRIDVDLGKIVLKEEGNNFISCSLNEDKAMTSNGKSCGREGALKFISKKFLDKLVGCEIP